jgi:hypothetical protein
MIDSDFKVVLIEVNTNPSLSTPCPLLGKIINNLIDATFRLTIDPIFLPPDTTKKGKFE